MINPLILNLGYIIFGLALVWDAYSKFHWKRGDHTVSGFIYKYLHTEPIVALCIGVLVGLFFKDYLLPIALGVLIGHLNWKA